MELEAFLPEDEDDDRIDRVRRNLVPKLARARFPGDWEARQLWLIFLNASQPWHRRALAVASLLYFVALVDFVPDFLPGGLADDLAVILFAYLSLVRNE